MRKLNFMSLFEILNLATYICLFIGSSSLCDIVFNKSIFKPIGIIALTVSCILLPIEIYLQKKLPKDYRFSRTYKIISVIVLIVMGCIYAYLWKYD